MTTIATKRRNQTLASIAIIPVALALAYAPIPGLNRSIVVVSGTELQEPLQALEARFEQEHPTIDLQLKFQGSQDIANRYLDDKNDFKPTVLIPANGEILQELSDRWKTQNGNDAFYEPPRPIAKTQLVAIAWSDRGKTLFPNGRFDWNKVEQAMQANSWSAIGGKPEWGSFDFIMTDPARSNSGQLTLSLWAQAKVGSSLTSQNLNTAPVQTLFATLKRSVYQPPRSTDVLLQEFIARGLNDADVATVYESIALHRWQQSGANQGKPYQIYYLNPTIETVSTAAIARREVDAGTADAARKFLDFLTKPEQQAEFVKFGFRPVTGTVDLRSVPNSPWSQGIPGAEVNPATQVTAPPNPPVTNEIVRLWERAN
jgi:ABC-type molybdate transport system substrate-binding protein